MTLVSKRLSSCRKELTRSLWEFMLCVAQWVKNQTAAAWVSAAALFRFSPLPGNFHLPQMWPLKKKKKKKKEKKNPFEIMDEDNSNRPDLAENSPFSGDSWHSQNLRMLYF